MVKRCLILKLIFIFLTLFILLASFTSAALIGVNKVQMDFLDVMKQGYSENTITLSSASPQNVSVFYETRGEIADWVRFEPADEQLILNDQNPVTVKVIVEPPSDARVDEYEGVLLLTTGPLGEVEGNIGASVVVAFEVKIKVVITDTQILTCNAAGYEIQDAEITRDIPFFGTISNTGNVRIKPEFNLDIYNQEQNLIVKTIKYTHNLEVLPTTTQRLEMQLDNELEPGQYWAQISAPTCGTGKSTITFSILEKGGISDIGELIRIENDPWALTRDTVPIKAYFRNRGDRIVSAEFKGTVSKDGKIIEILRSDVYDVNPNELAVIDVFFQPDEPGQYKINGRMYYNNKLSFEKGSILNVNMGENNGNSQEGLNLNMPLFLTLVVVIIGLLLFLILRRGKRQKNMRK